MKLYVISNETNEIVATINASSATDEFGKSDADNIEDVFRDKFGSNDYSSAYTDAGSDYADEFEEIELPE